MFNKENQIKKLVASEMVISFITVIKKQLGKLPNYQLSENITHKVSKNDNIIIEVYNKVIDNINV